MDEQQDEWNKEQEKAWNKSKHQSTFLLNILHMSSVCLHSNTKIPYWFDGRICSEIFSYRLQISRIAVGLTRALICNSRLHIFLGLLVLDWPVIHRRWTLYKINGFDIWVWRESVDLISPLGFLCCVSFHFQTSGGRKLVWGLPNCQNLFENRTFLTWCRTCCVLRDWSVSQTQGCCSCTCWT